MDKISELRTILSGFLFWNKARLDCFVGMLISLFVVRTINLREIAVGFNSLAEIESRYKRIKRFFAEFEVNSAIIGKWIIKLFGFENKNYYLTIDRTNWFWGKSKINILMIGIAYEGLAIPICWKLLPKAGNATAKEHIDMVKRFLKIADKDQIEGVLADREFASEEFFKWLNRNKVSFYIRIKEGSQVSIRKKKLFSAKKIFNDLEPKTSKVYDMSVELFRQKVFLAGSRSERGELMIVATNCDPRSAVPIYLRRWEIENLFQGLKSRGFRFEDTHVTDLRRIDKLMALLAVGFCWAHKVGEWRATMKAIKFNNYRDNKRPQYSYFRYGFDLIRDLFINTTYRTDELRRVMRQILLPDKTIGELMT